MPRRGTRLSPAAKEKNDAAIRKWKLEHYENLSIGLPKGKRDAYKQLAAIRGTSISAMVQTYMDEECRKDGVALPERRNEDEEG